MAQKIPTAKSNARSGRLLKRTAHETNEAAPEGRLKRQRTSAKTEIAQAEEPVPRPKSRPQTARGRGSAKVLPVLTQRPVRPLNIYVMGANSGGELGLGPSVKSGSIGKPRLNPYLSGSVGVVQLSLGAMHGVALTRDNTILTWGVNDHGALGRDTSWDGGLVDMDEDGSDSEDEGELNPKESTPTPIDTNAMPPDTVFTQIAATDNATFALTNTGRVYGWGSFRSEDGKLSFTPTVQVQTRPALVAAVQNIIKICCGSNHVLALTADGFVYTWGRGTDAQLGRRFSSRVVDWSKEDRLRLNHSFAIDRVGLVYGWGFNNAGQLGTIDITSRYESEYETALTVSVPSLLKSLVGLPRITQITGGNFHSIAIAETGQCLTWGRLYSFATGLKIDTLPPQFVVLDSRSKPSFLRVPTAVPELEPAFVAAASEHSLAVTVNEQVYSWGLNLTKQIAQKEEEVEVATPIRSSVVDKRFVWAGAGAQYSMLGELADI
ncbi:regulator of chromosome condensation 1/beta-lactamase-inhibitor protein II [Dichotomopilus funicola]|uniref:Regulator of chromosome condensation 1/beta-lactamase-inhibitor protein II n=1 Tax=Dichotomopilus funicola TaxID=1934379 RepID=A0AAN6V7M4_9PEZI|nr:regulator of chromosome condensation 1/beta-lactamase-inhibitor protein II [Dichotomopilus funicola]